MAILSIGELALRVSLRRGPQVGTCALGENPGIPRTRGPMSNTITDSLEKSKNIYQKMSQF